MSNVITKWDNAIHQSYINVIRHENGIVYVTGYVSVKEGNTGSALGLFALLPPPLVNVYAPISTTGAPGNLYMNANESALYFAINTAYLNHTFCFSYAWK